MPNNNKMNCEHTEIFRKAVAQTYKDFKKSDSFELSVTTDLKNRETVIENKINSQEHGNPAQEAIKKGLYNFSGY